MWVLDWVRNKLGAPWNSVSMKQWKSYQTWSRAVYARLEPFAVLANSTSYYINSLNKGDIIAWKVNPLQHHLYIHGLHQIFSDIYWFCECIIFICLIWVVHLPKHEVFRFLVLIRRFTSLETILEYWIVGTSFIRVASNSGLRWRTYVPSVKWRPWKLEIKRRFWWESNTFPPK